MDDLISRQAALDALDEPCKVPESWTDEYAVGERAQYEKDVKALNSLPPAERREGQPSGCEYWDNESNFCTLNRPSAVRRGRWTDHNDEWDGGYYECSVCGEAFTFIEGTPKENLYNYCPNCGARMEE